MLSKKTRNDGRFRRKRRIRRKVSGSAAKPRLTVFRSNRHIYAQLVDDVTGHTLASASTKDAELAGALEGKDKKAQAFEVAKLIASRAKTSDITSVVFDRNGYIDHGRVAAVDSGAREGGLDF